MLKDNYFGWILSLLLFSYFLYIIWTKESEEGFAAPYYIPWWRRYYQNPPYNYGGQYPYYTSAWYWWPYYGRPYYKAYWKNYGINV